MSGLAFADPMLEASFQRSFASWRRSYCNTYLAFNACLSVVAFLVMMQQPLTPKVGQRLILQASYAIVSIAALCMLNAQPRIFPQIANSWFFVQRLCVCVRCVDIRSVWFSVPGHADLLRPEFTSRFFFSTLLLPILLHCMGLPLPLYLDMVSAMCMMAILWAANAPFCGRVLPSPTQKPACASFLDDYVMTVWKREGKVVDASHTRYVAAMCQAKLGFFQCLAFGTAVLLGFGLELHRRRAFLWDKGRQIPGAEFWPFGSSKLVHKALLHALFVPCILSVAWLLYVEGVGIEPASNV